MMKRLAGKGKKQNISNESVTNASSAEVKVLLFPENTGSTRKKERSALLQTKNDSSFSSSDSVNHENLEEEDNPNHDLEIDTSLKRLEETEKKLKYHIRELESYLGLS